MDFTWEGCPGFLKDCQAYISTHFTIFNFTTFATFERPGDAPGVGGLSV